MQDPRMDEGACIRGRVEVVGMVMVDEEEPSAVASAGKVEKSNLKFTRDAHSS